MGIWGVSTKRHWPAVTVVGAGLAVAASTLAGCSSSGSSGSSQTIQYEGFNSAPNYNTWLRGQMAIFEKSHHGVKFTVQYTTPTYIVQKIKTAVAAGAAPDIAQMLPGAAQQQLFAAKRILNLTPYINGDAQWKSWITSWNKVPNSQYRAGSQIFATNVSMGPMLVWYWKSSLAQVGWKTFPTTIQGPQGLLALSKALKNAGLPAMANGLDSQALFNYDYTFYTLEANFDPGGVKASAAINGAYPWASPVFTQAVNLFKSLYDSNVFYPQALQRNYDPDSKTDFGNLKATSAWPFGPWMDGYYPAKDASKIGVARFPVLTASSPQTLTASNDLEFILPTVTSNQQTTAHKKLLIAFLKQLNSPESQKSLWSNGIMPVMASAASGPVANATYSGWASLMKQQIALTSTKYAVDENTYGPATASALDNGLEEVLSGKLSTSALLQQVQAANKQDHSCAPNCK
ncbi:MAG TPA: ABC transporter substrate-binding protein [Streptosporangiaceae bacterium]|jgi:ABC-type glycerol-3-phosphate transport system substrate-binding protein